VVLGERNGAAVVLGEQNGAAVVLGERNCGAINLGSADTCSCSSDRVWLKLEDFILSFCNEETLFVKK
jgi:hypothetical protein